MGDKLKEIFDELLALHGELEDENAKLTAEVERLRSLIKDEARHGINCLGMAWCYFDERACEYVYPNIHLCDCWKRKALEGEE